MYISNIDSEHDQEVRYHKRGRMIYRKTLREQKLIKPNNSAFDRDVLRIGPSSSLGVLINRDWSIFIRRMILKIDSTSSKPIPLSCT